jgi:hypothetical protein
VGPVPDVDLLDQVPVHGGEDVDGVAIAPGEPQLGAVGGDVADVRARVLADPPGGLHRLIGTGGQTAPCDLLLRSKRHPDGQWLAEISHRGAVHLA